MKQIYQMKGELCSRLLSVVFCNKRHNENVEWEEVFSSIFTFCFIAAARSSVDTFFSESRHPQYATEQRGGTKRTVSQRQSMQYGDEPSRHQKRSGAALRQFRNSQPSGFQYKDSNFEFSSDWNHTDSGFYGSVDVLSESVTEMTDAKMQELGFPVQTSTNPDPTFRKSSDSSERQNLPAPSVIDKHSQFFQLMSRKYCSPLENNWDPTC